jgi:homoserine kinase
MVRSEIPVARGLGSSAALVAAAAAAAGAKDPLSVAAEWDGHPENAAASVLGGLVTATMVAGRPVSARMHLDSSLGFVVLVPDRELATREARAVLPPYVPHQDAAFNLGRMGILLAGLADRRLLVRGATDDKLHQAARTTSFPEAPALLDGLVDAGALASCWSGAGPSILGMCLESEADRLRAAGEQVLAEAGVAGRSVRLRPDREGLRVLE